MICQNGVFSRIAIAALCLTGCTGSSPCPDQSVRSTTAHDIAADDSYVSHTDPYQPGELSIGMIDLPQCQDAAPWPMRIHAPTQSGIYPLVVFEHGFMATNDAYDEILGHLASHGFVVVAPQLYYPLPPAFLGDPTAVQEADRLQQVINWAPDHLESITGVHIRFDLLGLSGHSRGAKVAYILTSMNPAQITALGAVDPVHDGGGPVRSQPFVINGPFPFSLPTLIIGTALLSNCAPEGENNLQFYAATQSPVWHVVATNESHADLLDEDQAELASIICGSGSDRPGMRRLAAGLLTAFFRATLQGDSSSYALLSDTSSAPIPVTVENK